MNNFAPEPFHSHGRSAIHLICYNHETKCSLHNSRFYSCLACFPEISLRLKLLFICAASAFAFGLNSPAQALEPGKIWVASWTASPQGPYPAGWLGRSAARSELRPFARRHRRGHRSNLPAHREARPLEQDDPAAVGQHVWQPPRHAGRRHRRTPINWGEPSRRQGATGVVRRQTGSSHPGRGRTI